MNYWFLFYKSDIMLELLPDGTYTIPLCEEAPVEMKPWMHALAIAPMADGTDVKAVELAIPNTRCADCGRRSIKSAVSFITKRASVRNFFIGIKIRNTAASAVRR